MPHKTILRPAAGPRRSTGAARAHAAGDLQWTIDLTQSPARVVDRAHTAVRSSVISLSVVAAAVWAYDLSQLAG